MAIVLERENHTETVLHQDDGPVDASRGGTSVEMRSPITQAYRALSRSRPSLDRNVIGASSTRSELDVLVAVPDINPDPLAP